MFQWTNHLLYCTYLDTIQMIAVDRRHRQCLFVMSYRDTKAEPRVAELLDGLQSQGVHLWK
jgi:hypothetical protein